ncbi:MAG: tetratricopeptide repeat protein [Planctomycetes bacterium]|nr:tetratricopeptide repeat protein [Planctomycetota bacterium]
MTRETNRTFRGSFSGYERDCYFHNPDGVSPRFYPAAYVLGLDFDDDGRAAAPVDIDGDGDLDLVLAGLQGLRLVENTSPTRHFARLRLRAVKTPAVALGAVASVRTGDVTQRDFVKLTDGFQTQVPADLSFGLGDAARLDEVTVAWPSGATETWRDLPADRLLELVEGRPEAKASALERWPEGTRPRRAPAFSLDAEAERLDGGARERLAAPGRPTVLNFWSPACAACRAEAGELASLAVRCKAEARVVGVSAETKDVAAVRKAVEEGKPPYVQYLASEALLASFFGDGGAVALPATFVFDAAGRLRRAFFRPITEAEVAPILASMRDPGPYAADLRTLGHSCLEHGEFEPALGWFGKLRDLKPADPVSHFLVGVVQDALGRPEAAAACYAAAIERDPRYADARLNLGVVLVKGGRPKEGLAALEAGIQLKGEDPEALSALVWAAMEAGDTALALSAAARAVKANPRSGVLLAKKGGLHRMLGQFGEARKCFEEALRLEPGLEEVRQEVRAMDEAGEGR